MTKSTTTPVPKPKSTLISDYWSSPATVGVTDFQFKSLCDFIFNTAVGCSHGCRFCYVPSTATNKQATKLKPFGVDDPDEQWGDYVLVRPWDEKVFLSSLKRAENLLENKLKPEGHRAVMFCSTTDPYQTIKNADPKLAKEYNKHHREMVRRALELIRDKSTLNVRILTRSPLAGKDFDLFKSFGDRLVFGMSLPTLNDKLAKVFEPTAPGVAKRLETLQAAKDAGLHVYVAMAPTYPECDEADLQATLTAIAKLEPLTVFHEPINIRAENVERIRKHGEELGFTLNLKPFETPDAWRKYSWEQFQLVENVAAEVGLSNCLHLWPDKDMPTKKYLQALDDPTGFVDWLNKWWTRVSEWPE
ncbi:MAG TPA: radical SAM protein [Chthoniobacter sp.]|jgi:DNA repair photolyase